MGDCNFVVNFFESFKKTENINKMLENILTC